MPFQMTLPSDIEARLGGLGEAIAASCPDVLFAYLFGSAATGLLTTRSDVDLAVFVAPDADAHALQLAVARVAARQLGSDAVDVVVLNTAPVSLAG
ncbi:MAG: nucleotidyltransferase domain-containing protein, partial [Acidobacteria bacterium]|nr:nucleotidyltransferase domain-containing protein [Acidobacteriota bacterium]